MTFTDPLLRPRRQQGALTTGQQAALIANLRPIASRTHRRPVTDLYDWASRDHETTVPPPPFTIVEWEMIVDALFERSVPTPHRPGLQAARDLAMKMRDWRRRHTIHIIDIDDSQVYG